MQNLNAVLRAIPAPDADAMARAQQHIDGLLKPPGSLGRLEALAVQLAGMPGLGGQPQVAKKALLVMCADHGVWDEGVAISPKAVTAIQAANMTRGTTGVCVLAAQAGAKVHVIDVGIDSEPLPGVVNMRVARGCGNIARGPAMSREQGQELLLEVMRYTRALAQEGVTLFGVGELGMANTTPAAAIVSVLTGSDAQEVVGIGANLPLAKVGNKVEVVRRAIAVNQPDPNDGLDVLSKVGGFDLLGMTGVMLGAASCGLPVVLDGFLSYAAALAACQIAPEVKPYLIPSHYSAEKGARIALAHLGLEPYLNMGMRLGEGSGAALAMALTSALSPVPVAGYSIAFIAACGGGVSWLLVMTAGGGFRHTQDRNKLILAGIAFSAFCMALTRITLLLTEDHAYGIFYWLAGGVSHVRWQEFWQLFPMVAVALPVVLLLANQLNLLNVSDSTARTLGVNLPKLRLIINILVLLLVGACVSAACVIVLKALAKKKSSDAKADDELDLDFEIN